MKKLSAALVVASLVLLSCSCAGGYSFTGASIPVSAKAISIKEFPNYAATINPQLSQQLYESLRSLFQSQTSLSVIQSDGDMDISGEITAYSTRAASISSSDQVASNRFTITIRVRFTNSIDPQANFDQSFSRYRDYNAQLDFASVESALTEEIVAELCDDIFNKAVVNW